LLQVCERMNAHSIVRDCPALVGDDVAAQVLDQGDRASRFWGW
jgi:hypothetical protein